MKAIDRIKKQIVRQAVSLTPGGFRPANTANESWIGKVYLFKEEEGIPTDQEGVQMIPLLQLCMESMPFIPALLKHIHVLTIFIGEEMPDDVAKNGEGWLIRTYSKEDKLIIFETENENSKLKAFPLKATMVKEDYPVWDGGGLSEALEDEIVELEESGEILDYGEVAENIYGHKLGGYPSFNQPGIDFGPGFEFVLQISSDDKVGLNIVDQGTLFFAVNKKTNEWKMYSDFY